MYRFTVLYCSGLISYTQQYTALYKHISIEAARGGRRVCRDVLCTPPPPTTKRVTSGVAVSVHAAPPLVSRSTHEPFAIRTCVRAHNRRARFAGEIVVAIVFLQLRYSYTEPYLSRPSLFLLSLSVSKSEETHYLIQIVIRYCCRPYRVTLPGFVAVAPFSLPREDPLVPPLAGRFGAAVSASAAQPDGMSRRPVAVAVAVVVATVAAVSLMSGAFADTVSADVLPDGEVEIRVSAGNVTAKRTSFTSPDTG